IRRGLYGSLKGAERLQKGFVETPAGRTNYDLNVELKQSGGVTVVPPQTNAPSATSDANPPATSTTNNTSQPK
ncbi:MAG TPA: hypothetical protein VGR78_17260, partial [Verrucomicrobiae bacterium]|nr:hypothetical protein [Verrucomicrobiae bacterium]